MTKDHILETLYGTKWPMCADVPLSSHSFIFIHSFKYQRLQRMYLQAIINGCTYTYKSLGAQLPACLRLDAEKPGTLSEYNRY